MEVKLLKEQDDPLIWDPYELYFFVLQSDPLLD